MCQGDGGTTADERRRICIRRSWFKWPAVHRDGELSWEGRKKECSVVPGLLMRLTSVQPRHEHTLSIYDVRSQRSMGWCSKPRRSTSATTSLRVELAIDREPVVPRPRLQVQPPRAHHSERGRGPPCRLISPRHAPCFALPPYTPPGTIPTQIGQLVKMTYNFDLAVNSLSSAIPTGKSIRAHELHELTSLEPPPHRTFLALLLRSHK